VSDSATPDDGSERARRSAERAAKRARGPAIVAVVATVALGLVATVAVARWRRGEDVADQREQLAVLAEDETERVQATILRYADLLSVLGAFQAQPDPSAADFARFIESLDIGRFPGVQRSAYLSLVRTEDAASFQAAQRAAGDPDFTVELTADGDRHAILTYGGPGPLPTGLDLMGDPVRRAALEQSVERGIPVVSDVVVQISDVDLPLGEQETGLAVYAPVYSPGAAVSTVDERWAALEGWAAIGVDLGGVVEAQRLDEQPVSVAVLDADRPGDGPIAESRPGILEHIEQADVSRRAVIDTGSLRLELRMAFPPGQEPPSDLRYVLAGGALATLLAAYAVYGEVRFRRGLLTEAAASRERAAFLQSRFHAAVDRAPVGVTVVGFDGTVEVVNDRLHELLEIPRSGSPRIFDYVLPEDVDEIQGNLADLRSGAVAELVTQKQLRRPDGELVWCRISVSAIPGDDGQPVAVVAHVQDIEAELVAVEALRSRTRWFSSIVERASDLVLLFDRDLVVTWASPSLATIAGLQSADVLGASVLELVHPDDRPRLAEAIEAFTDPDRPGGLGPTGRAEFRVQGASGEEIWLETTASNLLDDPDVAAVITLSRDVTERHRSTQLLAHRAAHDPLTGLLNRDELHVRLRAALAHSSYEPVMVAYLDLDGFKAVNDDRGHGAGDDLLRVVADALRAEVRGQDLLARLGGDEFVIVLDGTPLSDALEVAERIRSRLARPVGLPGGGEPVQLSVSIGLAMAVPQDTVASLLHAADLALYEAKRRGRDRVEVSTRGLAAVSDEVDELLDGVLREPEGRDQE
jgi:diguanylate cyclase (GGDEF)-like protein/PAS domain S-box-containing protein